MENVPIYIQIIRFQILPVIKSEGILSVKKSTTSIRLVANITPPCV